VPVMNRRMASTLGLCRPPLTVAEGLSLFHPSQPGKGQSSMATKSAAKQSRFAHLADIGQSVLPPQRGSASSTVARPAGGKGAPAFASAKDAVSFILQAGGRHGARR
jgi:hypothetical protein